MDGVTEDYMDYVHSEPWTMDYGEMSNETSDPGNSTASFPIDVLNRLLPSFVVYVAIVTVLGIIGNTFTAIIMLRERFRKMNISVFLFSLAIADTAQLLLSSLMRRWIWSIFKVSWIHLSNPICVTGSFFRVFSKYTASWLLVAVSIDRVIAIALPNKYAELMNRRRAIAWVASICLVMVVISSSQFFVTYLYTYGPISLCFYGNPTRGMYMELLDTAIYSIIPSLIMMVCNIILITKIVKSIRFRRASGAVGHVPQMERLTWMLVATSIVFIVFTLPLGIFNSYYLTQLNFDYTVYLLMLALSFSNHGINGYVYCFSGSLFREELLKLFKCSKV